MQNMHIGKLVAEDYKATLKVYYTPRVLTTNSLVFNQPQMKAWWEEGYEYAKNHPHNQ